MAQPARQQGSSLRQRKSWRTPEEEQHLSGRALRARRFMGTVLGLGLVGLFLYLLVLWIWPSSKLVIASLTIGDYDAEELPPIPFVYEDRQGLDAFGHEANLTSYKFSGPQELQNALRDKLADTVHGRDRVLLYLSAHGIGDNGEPYVLLGQYQVGKTGGRYKVSQLLTDLGKSSSASAKVLLIDVGRTGGDPRLGVVVNEFPRLVEQEVANPGVDNSVWVILSNSQFERSHISYGGRRSIFNYFLVEGLRGGADEATTGNQDREISLLELFDYVHTQVTGWVWDNTAQTESQTPVLLRGGKGRVKWDAPDDRDRLAASNVVLWKMGRPKPPPKEEKPAETKPAAEKPPAGKTAARSATTSLALGGISPIVAFADDGGASKPATDAKEIPKPVDPKAADAKLSDAKPSDAKPADAKTEKPDKPKSGDKQEAGETKPDKKPTDAAPPPSPPAQPPAPLPPAPDGNDALREILRDKQEAAQKLDNQPWGPRDYAPHLWRFYRRSLAAFAQRSLGGQEFVAMIKARAPGLKPLDRVADLDRQFSLGAAKKSYDRDPELAAVIRDRNRLMFEAPDFVAWHDLNDGAWASGETRQQLTDLIARLKKVADLFEQPPAGPDSVDPDDAAATRWRRELSDQHTELLKIEGRLLKTLQEQVDALAGSTEPGTAEHALELVGVPLLTAKQRAGLMNAMVRLAANQPLKPVPESVHPKSKAEAVIERLKQRAELDVALAQLVNREPTSASLTGSLQGVAQPASLPQDDFCQAGRKLGLQLRMCYEAAPDAVAEKMRSEGAGAWKAWRAAESMIRLADARDATAIDEQLQRFSRTQWVNPFAGIGLPQPKGTIVIDSPRNASGGGPIELSMAGATTLTWTMRAEGNRRLPSVVKLQLKYDKELVQVQDREGQLLTPGQVDDLVSKPGEKALALDYQVTPLKDSGEPTAIEIHWSYDGKGRDTRTELALPTPRYLEIFARGQLGTISSPDGAETAPVAGRPGWVTFRPSFGKDFCCRLAARPFPTGETEYQFTAHNASATAKKMKYSLYAWARTEPGSVTGHRPPTSFVWDLAQPPPPGCEKLLEQEIAFPPSGTQPLPFSAAAIAPPAKEAPKDGTAPKPAAPPPSDADRQFDRYLVAVLEDIDHPGDREALVLDVQPQHPAAYLKPEVSYDPQDGVLHIDVAPLGADRLPAAGSRIEWQPDEAIFHASQAKITSATLRPGQTDPAHLKANVLANAKESVRVYLTADGYPRAFFYEAPLSTLSRNVERTVLNWREIAIVAPKKESELFCKDKAWLKVDLQADAPPAGATDHRYNFRIRVEPQPKVDGGPSGVEAVFDRDRDFDTRLVAGAPAGALRIKSAVHDLSALLDTSGFQNQRLLIHAALEERPRDGVEPREMKHDDVTVVFDSTPPKVLPVETGDIIGTQGDALEIKVKATDELSGVKVVEASFERDDEKGTLKMPKKARPSSTEKDVYVIGFTVEEIKALPPGSDHRLWVDAIDRVGNSSEPIPLKLTINKPPPPPDTTTHPLAKTQKITGTVVYTRGVEKAAVRLFRGLPPTVVTKDTPPPTPISGAVTDQNGKFTIDGVDPGDYYMVAEGKAANKIRKTAPMNLHVDAPPAPPPAPVKLELE